MSDQANYYQLLHVHPDAPVEIIKASYRTLMQRLKMHPDLGGDHTQAALINTAYETLTDTSKRAEYDKTLGQPTPRAKQSAEPASRQAPNTNRQPPRGAITARCGFCGEEHRQLIDADSACRRCDSPLQRHKREAVPREGARALERIPKAQPVKLYRSWPDKPTTGLSRDISLDGMLVELTSQCLQANTTVKITCDILQATAKVVHIKQEANGKCLVGMAFETLSFRQSRGTFVTAQA